LKFGLKKANVAILLSCTVGFSHSLHFCCTAWKENEANGAKKDFFIAKINKAKQTEFQKVVKGQNKLIYGTRMASQTGPL